MMINVLTGVLLGVVLWSGRTVKSLAGIHSILWLAALIMPLAAALATFARFKKGRLGFFARTVVQSLQQVVYPKMKRVVGLLAGVTIVAAFCWAVTGSGYALGVALYGILLATLLSYSLYGLAVFALHGVHNLCKHT